MTQGHDLTNAAHNKLDTGIYEDTEMTQGQHTPGPWREENGSIKAISHGRWFTVATVNKRIFTPTGITVNAKLMASAPQLLADREESRILLSESALMLAIFADGEMADNLHKRILALLSRMEATK